MTVENSELEKNYLKMIFWGQWKGAVWIAVSSLGLFLCLGLEYSSNTKAIQTRIFFNFEKSLLKNIMIFC